MVHPLVYKPILLHQGADKIAHEEGDTERKGQDANTRRQEGQEGPSTPPSARGLRAAGEKQRLKGPFTLKFIVSIAQGVPR